MRTRIWLLVIAVLVVGTLLLLFRATRHEQRNLQEASASTTDQPTNQPEPQNGTQDRQVRRGAESLAVPSVAPATRLAEAIAETNPLAALRLKSWQAPIEFYGKVVDESGSAVAGAKIGFRWAEVPAEDGNRYTNAESDAEGLFSLHSQRGPDLSVSVSKEGYYPAQGGAQYGRFGNFSPDPENPVVFKLHKRGPGAELLTSENGPQSKVDVRVPKDNTPVQVDLFQRHASATGQLEVRQNKPPWEHATEWSFSLSLPGGGLVENADEFQFEAPDTNYQQSVEYRFTKDETNWTTQAAKQFYIAFGEPRKYGWLRIESNLDQETVFLTYAINPTGSRNLEPLEVKPQAPPPPSWLPPGVKAVIPEFK
jgi:hypothetical protein